VLQRCQYPLFDKSKVATSLSTSVLCDGAGLMELLCSMCLVAQDAENLKGRKLFNVAEDVLRSEATIWSTGSLQ